jgi:photosystem II stability/assembly factor-like uncharacterized protein
MKRFFLFLILNFSLLIVDCNSEQYGWTNIGSRLPNTISTATISGISMVGDSIWVISGYGTYQNNVPGEIYFSSDRGNTFTIQSTKYGTHAIYMFDSKRGYCGGVEGQIYRTTNGGEVWERWTSIGRTLMSIDFPPGCDTGFCSGFTGGVKMITPTQLITVDMSDYVSNIYSVSCIDREHAFVAGEEIIGPVIRGVLQIDQSYPGTNGIYAIDMVDTLYGWCVGSPTGSGTFDSAGCMIIRTADGHNWEEQVNPVKGKGGTLMAIKAINKSEAWTVGTSGVILHTSDGGVNWIREAEGLTNEMLYGIWVVDNKEVYVTGNNRTLLKYGPITDVIEPVLSKNKFSINPNPASTFANFTVLSGWASIYDWLGIEVWSGNIFEGKSFDVSNFQDGLYICKIQNGNHIESLKFIVLK